MSIPEKKPKKPEMSQLDKKKTTTKLSKDDAKCSGVGSEEEKDSRLYRFVCTSTCSLGGVNYQLSKKKVSFLLTLGSNSIAPFNGGKLFTSEPTSVSKRIPGAARHCEASFFPQCKTSKSSVERQKGSITYHSHIQLDHFAF